MSTYVISVLDCFPVSFIVFPVRLMSQNKQRSRERQPDWLAVLSHRGPAKGVQLRMDGNYPLPFAPSTIAR